VLRAYVLTIHRSELTVIGHLSYQDWNRVQACIRTAFSISKGDDGSFRADFANGGVLGHAGDDRALKREITGLCFHRNDDISRGVERTGI
jgi:hypothetical protein